MNSSKISRDKEYSVLLKKLQEAKRRKPNRPERITGIYLEIAEYMRNGLLMVDEAKENYNRVILSGKNLPECSFDSSLAYRNLAEIAIEENDYDSAIEKIGKSLECAYMSNDPGIIQQSLHQRAHICLSCELPDKALEFAETCRNYLNENATKIDALKKDGDSKCRMAHLQNLMAAIYMAMDGCKNKGLEVNEKAIKYASENSNWSLYYRCLHTKLNLTNGRDRIQIAEMMCNIAGKIVPKNSDEKKFKRESKCTLALEKLRFCEEGNVGCAKKLLWKCFEDLGKDPESASPDFHEELKKALVFVYKVKEREAKANSMNVRDNAKRRKAQMVVFEKIGDDASKLEMNEIALYYYQRMLKCADSAENQKKAWCSMAEAAKDCCLFDRAVEFYKQARAKEVELGFSANQLFETDIAIAILSAEVESISLERRLEIFKEVYAKCISREHKKMILPDYVKFLKANPNLCSKNEFEEKMEEKNQIESEVIIGEEEEEVNLDESPEEDEFDAMSDSQIIFEIKNEMKTLDSQEKIIKERSNKNKHGESNLHEVARSDDYQLLKQLIDRGYDINQLDHGGWTPLSEAVAAQKLANVRLLLMSGANPNTRSTEFLVDNDQNKITSSGLTPLMEACSFGNIDIVKILLQFKTRAATKDDDDWTALEYLWEFLLNAHGLDGENREKLERIVDVIKQKQMEEGFIPRNFDEFLDLVELKKSSRNNKKKNSTNSRKNRNNTTEAMPSSSRIFNDRSAWIDDDSDFENMDKEKEESEDEEVRNLEDYQKCISGLRNRSSENPKSTQNRKRPGGSSAPKNNLSKKMFLRN